VKLPQCVFDVLIIAHAHDSAQYAFAVSHPSVRTSIRHILLFCGNSLIYHQNCFII